MYPYPYLVRVPLLGFHVLTPANGAPFRLTSLAVVETTWEPHPGGSQRLNVKTGNACTPPMKPVIGITSRYSWKERRYNLPDAYVKAVHRNGGLPLVLPPYEDADLEGLYAQVDGLLFTGGPDVDPLQYGEQPRPRQGSIEPLRDWFELELARLALEGPKPVLGICRGLQVLNVAAGGTLIQDVGSQVEGALKHRQEAPAWYGTHRVEVEEGSLAHRVLGCTRVTANSFHHQACKEPGGAYRASAWAPDGVVEALEAEGEPWRLCVQWHPEHMDNPVMNRIFRALVEACGEG